MYNSDQWLLNHSRNIASQYGEDGILEKIFATISVTNGWCAELGAADGAYCSNTYNLLNNHMWRGVLIEGSKRKFHELQKTYMDNDRVILLNFYASFEGDRSLDKIFSKTPLPIDFDFLSIDVDGNDYHIWDSLKNYRPKVVCIEHNKTIPHHIEFIQNRDMNVWQGSSALSIKLLGEAKGYQLLTAKECNSIFILNEYYPLFGIINNNLDHIYTDHAITYIYQLFDGTLVLGGYQKMAWHGIDIRQDKLQVFPKYLRFLTYTGSLFKRILQKCYIHLYKNKLL